MIEIRWIYTEFDLTGKDSIFRHSVETRARAGGSQAAPSPVTTRVVLQQRLAESQR